MEIPALLVLNKFRLRNTEMNKIRAHCKDNKNISMHENDLNMVVHLHDERELPFHLWVFNLLCKTKER